MKSFYESHKEFDCDTPDECQFVHSTVSSTLMYFQPIFNRKGQNINPDRNTKSYDISCQKCGKIWSVSDNGSDIVHITRRLDLEKKQKTLMEPSKNTKT